mmetsp:Transcript_16300/g.15662  ORF Transcript_16300/g.15662 Transcript_16300/m.15662 type:complete len:99 (-) Transcript_16300:6-302(-)
MTHYQLACNLFASLTNIYQVDSIGILKQVFENFRKASSIFRFHEMTLSKNLTTCNPQHLKIPELNSNTNQVLAKFSDLFSMMLTIERFFLEPPDNHTL